MSHEDCVFVLPEQGAKSKEECQNELSRFKAALKKTKVRVVEASEPLQSATEAEENVFDCKGLFKKLMLIFHTDKDNSLPVIIVKRSISASS